MPDAFFSKPAAKRKRPSTGGAVNARTKASSSKSAASASASKPTTAAARGKKRRDEELSDGQSESGAGVDQMDFRRDDRGGESDDEERVRVAREGPGEKRLRIAREYLEKVEREQAVDDGTYDAAEIDRDIMAARLQSDVLSHSPKMHVFIASALASSSPTTYFLSIPSLPVTSAIASSSTSHLYVSSKSGGVAKYDLATGKLLVNFPRLPRSKAQAKEAASAKKGKNKAGPSSGAGELGGWSKVVVDGHSDEVLDLALSEDGKWLASAGKDGIVGCWDVEGEGGKWVRGMRGHRDAVTGVAFRSPTLTLYTTSLDRTVSIFSFATLSHLETLYGHQDPPTRLSTLRAETLITSGSRDRTVRFWKVADESQLVFRGGGASKGVWEDDEDVLEEQERLDKQRGKAGEGRAKTLRRKKRLGLGKDAYREGSIDCVAMIDEQNFLSGGDSGAISLWNITKKKPVFTNHLSHGIHEHTSETEGVLPTARWITSLACLPYGDVFASGSWDSTVRVWQISSNLKSFSPLLTIPLPGIINSLQLLVRPSTSFAAWSGSSRTLFASGSSAGDEDEDAADVVTPPAKEKQEQLILVVSVAQEPRLGRWMTLKGEGKDKVRNGVAVVHLKRGTRVKVADVEMED